MIQIPDHITEAEILALIEGDMASLPPERREVVREAVARDPVLSRIVGEIKADASAVVSFSRISAPPAIRAKVIEDLRRPAPQPERIREPLGGEIQVSSVIVTTESPWRKAAARLPVRRFAAAASLMLAAGLGVWLIREAVNYGIDHARTVAIAPDVRSSSDQPPVSSGTFPTKNEPAVALNLPTPSETPEPLVDATAASEAPPAIVVAEAPPVDSPAPDVDFAHAIELARAGRLIIRVRTINEAEAEDDIDRFAVRTADELKWRPLEAWELPQVTMALRERAPKATPYASERPPAPSHPTKVAGDPSRPALPPVEPLGTAADIAHALKQADFRPLYTVEMDESELDLAALLQQLSKGKSHVAEFVALEEPLPTLIPSSEPAAVLWWTRPPNGWTRRVCVPIVLETIP